MVQVSDLLDALGQVVASISKVFPKDTEAPPGGVDDMTKLSYLHEPGVLQNLAARYELNEIYVSCLSSFPLSAMFDAQASARKKKSNYKVLMMLIL